jgi:hypothetical protein
MMSARERRRAALKLLCWGTVATASVLYVVHCHRSGQLSQWFYHTASVDGYAVDADAFKDATPRRPALLAPVASGHLHGAVAVRVRQGQRLPPHANGVIADTVLRAGKRAAVDGDRIKVMVPWEMQQAKGVRFKDTFKHKGVKTYAWAGVWNVVMVLILGIALGFLAESVTDLLGVRLERIQHHEAPPRGSGRS